MNILGTATRAFIVLASLIAFLWAIGVIGPALAKSHCELPARTYADMKEWLGGKFKEQPRVSFMVDGPKGARPAELWVAKDGGSWTLIIHRIDGCVQPIIAGRSHAFTEPYYPIDGKDA